MLSGMLLMALIQVVFFHGPARRLTRTTGDVVQSTTKGKGASSAPWGHIEYLPLALDRPPEYFTNEVQREKTQWTFHLPESGMLGLFNSLDMDSDSKAFLTDRRNWNAIPDGFRIQPSPAVVINLKPDTREKLYEALSQWPENTPQRMPFLFHADGFHCWFDACGLSSNKLEIVHKMTYWHEGSLCFADAAMFSEVSAPSETMCLVRALWRVPTFVMSVRVTPGMDVETIVNYWGKSGRAAAYRPMLDAVSRAGEGTAVPISYFLPAFARMRLYTYPAPNDPRAVREDCFWSAMNFFNDTPDDRFFDGNETRRALEQEYTKVGAQEKALGDVVLLLGTGGKALHMCVYIADDVVFTKNGFATAQPWVLMKLDEMLGSYHLERPFELSIYRRKVIPHSETMSISAVRR